MSVAAVLLISLISATPVAATHTVEVAPMVGYLSGQSIQLDRGELALSGAPQLGLVADIHLGSFAQVELGYAFQPSPARFFRGGTNQPPTAELDVAFHMVTGGVLLELANAVGLRPFVSFLLGLTHMAPQADGYSADTQFTIVIGGGVKYALTDWLGLRAQAELRMTVLGGALFCQEGETCSTVVSSTYPQLGASGGAYLAF